MASPLCCKDDSFSSRLSDRLDPIFQSAISSRKLPAVSAVILNSSGRILYGKGFGRTTVDNAESPEVNIHSIGAVQSLTKLVTSIAFFQLLEQGRVELDAPVAKYVPEIADIEVLRGFDDAGKPQLSPPKNTLTILNLLTHTAGFSYDFFSQDTLRWRTAVGQTPSEYGSGRKDAFTSPLMFEPGTRYEYGVNTDWLGFVIERVTKQNLGEYVVENISRPLGLENMVANLSAEQAKGFFTIHLKDSTGQLVVMPPVVTLDDAEVKTPGGHFLRSSTHDYAQLLLTILHRGTHPVSGVTILKSSTVQKYILQDFIARIGVSTDNLGIFESAIPQLTCKGSMLPGTPKGYSCAGLLINRKDLPNGRKAGSGQWAGLDNCYYWLDPTTGIVAVLISAVFPFFDRDILHLFDAMERAVYNKPAARLPGQPGSNFEGGIVTAPPFSHS